MFFNSAWDVPSGEISKAAFKISLGLSAYNQLKVDLQYH